jgi:neutral ceramidase
MPLASRRTALLAVGGLLLLLSPGANAAPPRAGGGCEAVLCAGAGRAEVTPPVGTPLWGYGDRSGVLNPQDHLDQRTTTTATDTDLYAKAFRASEGIHQRLYARAFVVQDAQGDRVALVQLDLGSVSGPLHQEVAERLAPLGIDRSRLMLAPTHTHAGPGALHQAPFHFVGFGDMYDPRVLGIVRDGVVAAVEQAVASLDRARVAVGQVEVEGATRNRALDVHRRNPDADPTAPAELAVNRTLTMVRLDRADGAPLGVFTAFANHGTVEGAENALISGDNAGYAERLIEQGMARGGRPGAPAPIAAFANGEEGDVAPAAEGADQLAAAAENGRLQAEPALALWERLRDESSADLDLAVGYDAAPMSEGAATGYDMSPTPLYGAGGSCLPAALPGVGAKCPLAPSGPPPTWMPFQAVRLGDTLLLGLPWEVTTQAGRRIRAAATQSSGIGRVAVVGMTNDYGGYLTTPQEYTAQRYEGQMTWWGPEQAEWVSARAAGVARAAVLGGVLRAPVRDAAPGTDNASPLSQAAAALRAPAGRVVAQPPAEAAPGQDLAFTWTGGDASVDAFQQDPFVTVERRQGGGWEPAVVDGGGEVLVRFLRTAEANTWTATWRVPVDARGGRYRFRVTGTAYSGAGTAPYEVVSAESRIP